MSLQCEWCSGTHVNLGKSSVYWELPDGTRAIEISETPTVTCDDCSMVYQTETIVKEIENQLFLIDCQQIGKVIPFDELMKLPRLLKKNYFDFS